MSSDKQFTATGDADIGFQTTGTTIGVGADISGQQVGGKFHSPSGPGIIVESPNNRAVVGQDSSQPRVFGFLAGHDPQFNQLAGIYGQSDQQGVHGHTTSNSGTAVYGNGGDAGFAVRGENKSSNGFIAGIDPVFHQNAGVFGSSNQLGVFGNSTAAGGTGVFARGDFAVRGESANGAGFIGGIDSTFQQHTGVYGQSDQQGVHGRTTTDAGTGVYGNGNDAGFAVRGENKSSNGFIAGIDPVFHQNAGVYGAADNLGVIGHSTSPTGTGTFGNSPGGFGVRGETQSGVGVQGQAFGSGLAARFIGNVEVSGDIQVSGDVFLANRDLAEQFESNGVAWYEPGTLMIIGRGGKLEPCSSAYDKRAIGVISGAGTLRAAITLGSARSDNSTVAVALVGTAFCLVDADLGPIEAGDLLTSSRTPGHAMKAEDYTKSFGAIVGKALAPLGEGRALLPMIITLQ